MKRLWRIGIRMGRIPRLACSISPSAFDSLISLCAVSLACCALCSSPSFFRPRVCSNFGPQFMNGNPSVVYPFLLWMLENFPKLKTRGYLARYLVPLSIPEEHFADNQIVTMFQQYTMHQTDFKERHMQLEEVRAKASKPEHLQQEVTQLENEKEQLQTKLEKLRARIQNDPEYASVNFDDMLSITNKLRQEQETEAKLYNDAQEQRHKLGRAEAHRIATAKKFQEMNHSDMGRMDPLKLVAKLRDEVHARREHLETRLEAAISDKEKQLKQLSKLANSNTEYTAEDLHDLSREKHDLSQDIDALLQKRENSALSNDSKITFIRDRLSGVEKRREKLAEQIHELEDEQAETERDLKKAHAELKAATGGSAEGEALLPSGQPRPRTDAAMKEYMTDLNRKTQRYKSLKAELELEKNEVGVLERTEEILRSRATNLEAFNAEQEARLGVKGYLKTQDDLENLAAASHTINASKGETLEELSAIIDRIRNMVAQKKEKLAPQIKDLRGVRADYEAIEAVYKSKKNVYENLLLGFESEKQKLEQDVQTNRAGVQEEESHFHFLQCFSQITAARLQQVSKEATLKDLYERSINDQESITKSLRNEKKIISEKHEDHVNQRNMFQSLRGILHKKMEITKANAAAGGQGQLRGGQQQQQQSGSFGSSSSSYGSQQQGQKHKSYLDELAEESDRLVLEQ